MIMCSVKNCILMIMCSMQNNISMIMWLDPSGVLPPSVQLLTPSSVRVSWQPAVTLNGPFVSYIISLPSPIFTVSMLNQTSVTITNLSPFTTYSATITVCSGRHYSL